MARKMVVLPYEMARPFIEKLEGDSKKSFTDLHPEEKLKIERSWKNANLNLKYRDSMKLPSNKEEEDPINQSLANTNTTGLFFTPTGTSTSGTAQINTVPQLPTSPAFPMSTPVKSTGVTETFTPLISPVLSE